MNQVFISYARVDGQWVTHLRTALAEMGITVWIDREIAGGTLWDDAIHSGIEYCQVVIAVMSPHVTSTSFVVEEIATAERLRKPILPVVIERCYLPPQLQHLSRLQFTDLSVDFLAGLQNLAGTLAGYGIYRGVPLPIPPPAPAEPAPSDLIRVVQGSWLADVRFASGPLQVMISLAPNNQFVGSIAKPSALLPELFPYQGSWAASGRELFTNGYWTNVMNGSSRAWGFTTFFTRIPPYELSGFTLPERFSCTWRRNG